MPVTRLDGALDWAQLAGLLTEGAGLCRARYLGDASGGGGRLSDRRAVTDRPIRGCGDPGRSAGLDTMWAATGKIQERGNVWLVQNAFPCTPCQLEGCERRLDSYSACLDDLPARQVIAALDQVLASKR